jgi:hypothetical protein
MSGCKRKSPPIDSMSGLSQKLKIGWQTNLFSGGRESKLAVMSIDPYYVGFAEFTRQ